MPLTSTPAGAASPATHLNSRGNPVQRATLYLGYGANLVNYTSSVDRWPLSYYEWLPSNYSASRTYPLIVYLHGQSDTSGTWYLGGLASDLMLGYIAPNGTIAQNIRSLVNDTRALGFILIATNSRSGASWYVDSPCGGPQQQDVLDAIHHEQALRSVGKLYLFGSSMGSEGTLTIAASHRIFAGIGIVMTVTDVFQDVAYRESLGPNVSWAIGSVDAKAHDFCGVLPGTGNASQLAVAREYENMSPLRFDPTAFVGVPIFVTAGGDDYRAPNNVAIWSAWMDVNNTFVNSTCNYAPSLGEPNVCSTPLNSLHLKHPKQYSFDYIYEKNAGHDLDQLDPLAMLDFWMGTSPGGFYLGDYPFTSVSTNSRLTY